MKDGIWYIVTSKHVTEQKVRTDLTEEQKATAIANNIVTDDMIEVIKQKKETWYRYLSMKDIVEEIEVLLTQSEKYNSKELLAQFKSKNYWTSNLESFIQATIDLIKQKSDIKSIRKNKRIFSNEEEQNSEKRIRVL